MKTNLSFIVLVLTSLCLYSCGKSEPVEQEVAAADEQTVSLTDNQVKGAGIQIGSMEQRQLSSVIQVNGMLDVPPQNLVTISALMGGFIKSTDLLQGMKVKKGQTIAVIQNPDFITVQREYLENKSHLVFLEQEYKRQEELAKENVSAAKVFQQVSADYHSALIAKGALEEKLQLIGINPAGLNQSNIRSSVSIVSPINGYVTVVNINIGKFVNPQDIICEIVDTEHLHAELTVFEKDITKVKVGQKIRFTLVNESGTERTAHVFLINHKISADRTVRVHAHLDKEDPSLIPNMYLKAYIELGDNKVPSLPDQAIVNAGGKEYVFVQTAQSDAKSSFKAIEIKKGVSENGFTEIVTAEGQDLSTAKIVVAGAYSLLSAMNNTEEEE